MIKKMVMESITTLIIKFIMETIVIIKGKDMV